MWNCFQEFQWHTLWTNSFNYKLQPIKYNHHLKKSVEPTTNQSKILIRYKQQFILNVWRSVLWFNYSYRKSLFSEDCTIVSLFYLKYMDWDDKWWREKRDWVSAFLGLQWSWREKERICIRVLVFYYYFFFF